MEMRLRVPSIFGIPPELSVCKETISSPLLSAITWSAPDSAVGEPLKLPLHLILALQSELTATDTLVKTQSETCGSETEIRLRYSILFVAPSVLWIGA